MLCRKYDVPFRTNLVLKRLYNVRPRDRVRDLAAQGVLGSTRA